MNSLVLSKPLRCPSVTGQKRRTKVQPLHPTLRKLEVKVTKKRAWQLILLFLGKKFNNSLKYLDIKWRKNA